MPAKGNKKSSPSLKDKRAKTDNGPAAEVTQGPPPDRHGLRRFLAGLSVILACLLAVISIYAVFLQRTLLDTERYTANMHEIIKEPAVKQAVSQYATDELFIALKVQERISDLLPEKAKIVAAPATLWLRGFTQQEIQALLETKQFEDIWTKVNKAAHEEMVAVLRGEGKNVKVSNEGAAYIDLMPIVRNLALEFTKGTKIYGLVKKIPEGVVGPTLKAGLSKALGVELPDDFGQLVILKPEQLSQARQVVYTLDMAATWMPFASVLFFALALTASVDRRRTTMQLGLGLIAAAALAVLASKIAVKQALLAIADDTVREIATAIVGIELRGLPEIFINIAIAGLIIWVVSFLLGKRNWLVKSDSWIRARIGYATPKDLAKHPLIRWVNKHVNELRVALLVMALIVLLLVQGWWGVGAFGVVLAVGEAKLRYLTGWEPFKHPG